MLTMKRFDSSTGFYMRNRTTIDQVLADTPEPCVRPDGPDSAITNTPYVQWLIDSFHEKGVDLLNAIGYRPGISYCLVSPRSFDEFDTWEDYTNPMEITFTFRDDDCTLACIVWNGSFKLLCGFVNDDDAYEYTNSKQFEEDLNELATILKINV